MREVYIVVNVAYSTCSVRLAGNTINCMQRRRDPTLTKLNGRHDTNDTDSSFESQRRRRMPATSEAIAAEAVAMETEGALG